ncbi:hypothetical protein FHY19_004321 [Xanthomonas arboricola]|nr:hypothetical protein [Xanthomonas sp. 4461]
MDLHRNLEPCPKCGRLEDVRPKTLLIGKESPSKKFRGEEPAGYRRPDQLAVDEVVPEELRAEPLSQFIDGLFCDACGAGFVADQLLVSKSGHSA